MVIKVARTLVLTLILNPKNVVTSTVTGVNIVFKIVLAGEKWVWRTVLASVSVRFAFTSLNLYIQYWKKKH